MQGIGPNEYRIYGCRTRSSQPCYGIFRGRVSPLHCLSKSGKGKKEMVESAARLVEKWALVRQGQLRENWRLARAGEQLEKVAGLDAD
jgi:hypothetical protein